jgi:hypothetical protein
MPRTTGAFIVRYNLHRPDPKLQPVLGDLPPQEPEPTYVEKFLAFHAQHPEVYDRLLGLALAEAQAGRTVRPKRLVEHIRSEIPGGFDNGLTAIYARQLNQHPELHGRVAMRARKAE